MKNDDDEEVFDREDSDRSHQENNKKLKSKAFSSPGKIHKIY